MKTFSRLIVTICFTLIPFQATYAETLSCGVKGADEFRSASPLQNRPDYLDESEQFSAHVFLGEIVLADCNDGYSVELYGFGPGLRMALNEGFILACPFVRDFRGEYYGTRLSVGFMLGLSAGVYVGHGTCFITGLSVGFGAGVSGGKVIVRHKIDTAPVSERIVSDRPAPQDMSFQEQAEERKGE